MIESQQLATTRTAYDTVAADYAELLQAQLAQMPLDRALLATFAERVLAAGGGPVADLGCGPGRLIGHLSGLGLSVFGVDLAPGMVAVARRAHPQVRFAVGSLDRLAEPAGSVAGLLAWYSIIHTATDELSSIFAEFGRVARPGAELLIAFQAGTGERLERAEAYGHPVRLVSYRHPVSSVLEQLRTAGFEVDVQVIREPSAWYERNQQAYLLGRKVG
jgi:SAM-dependent methyltransferase